MELLENNRLDHDDPDSERFQSFLLDLRNGENTTEQWEYVCKECSKGSMDQSRWTNEFESMDATFLFCTNKEVAARNVLCLQNVDSPIVLVEASHSGLGHRGSDANAGGLMKKIYLCKGAKVLFTKNVWQAVGLCNGASGIVIDMVYDPSKPPPALPICLVVDFGDDYSGPSFFENDDDRSKWVPLFPVVNEWYTPGTGDSVRSSREMFPIRLCYAWTIWKAQGQTLTNKVVLSLGDIEREHGLTYTAFSRVKRFSDLGLKGGLTHNRLTLKVRQHPKMAGRMKEERRLRKIVQDTIRILRSTT